MALGLFSLDYALLFQSALMGAFLSVILPTFTVVILLIGLSIYDIYSVRRGPIKDIVKYTLEDENKYITPNARQNNINSKTEPKYSNNHFRSVFSIKMSFDKLSNNYTNPNSTDEDINPALDKQLKEVSAKQPQQITIQSIPQHQQMYQHQNMNQRGQYTQTTQVQQIPQRPQTLQTQKTRMHQKHQEFQQPPSDHFNKIYEKSNNLSNDVDDTDTILTSMTYSSQDWDIGIGDLVFYSMLASQPLTPYFIFNHGMYLLETYGIWIFWLICLCTIIGILIGFIITIRLLERNSMLPGLPLSIALGLTGFLGSTLIFSFI